VFVLSVGNTLKISDVNEKDNGEYTCEVETKDRNNPKSISHKLLVLQRPQIFTSSSQHNLTVIKGSSVVLN
jgi:ABC-type transport system involved in cytochrome bd biosynthesis fused ATPase/permease subunit